MFSESGDNVTGPGGGLFATCRSLDFEVENRHAFAVTQWLIDARRGPGRHGGAVVGGSSIGILDEGSSNGIIALKQTEYWCCECCMLSR